MSPRKHRQKISQQRRDKLQFSTQTQQSYQRSSDPHDRRLPEEKNALLEWAIEYHTFGEKTIEEVAFTQEQLEYFSIIFQIINV